LSDNLQNKNFKISIGSFSLQGKPALLIPWMVFTIFFLVANTVLYIGCAVQYFAMGYTAIGAGYMIGAVIYFCK
jgi:hypothetical protein